MSNKETKSSSNIFSTIVGYISSFLTMLFITLRACDIINWNWYWVMSPFLIPLSISIICVCVVGIITMIENKRGN